MRPRQSDQVIALLPGQESVVQLGTGTPREVLDPAVPRVEPSVQGVGGGAVGLRVVSEDGLGAVLVFWVLEEGPEEEGAGRRLNDEKAIAGSVGRK